jgi:drug/metabolite transporter (DMT)-like permease
MHWSRIVGIALVVVGAILLYFGYEASQSIAEDVRRELTGTFSDETTRYFVGGGAAIVLGLLLGIFGVKRGR